MLTFVTDIQTTHEPDILATVKDKPLLLLTIDGQLLARYEAPQGGWTHLALCRMNRFIMPAWSELNIDAFLGEQWVGSSEI